jgi:hypothetical protein
MMDILCPYCGTPAHLVGGDTVYPNRPDLRHLWFWICVPCDAYVGTHKNSPKHKPLGRLANANLRYWKMMAHAAFDTLWQHGDGNMTRNDAYAWLALRLGIDIKACHIGMFDIDTCRSVVDICKKKATQLALD